MIDRLYEIARLENDLEEGDDSYAIFIDKFPDKIDYDKFALLLINLEKQNSGLVYKDVSQLGINNNNKETIARKLWKISTKGRENGPCANYNSKLPDSFINKIINFFSKENGIDEERISKILEENKPNIVNEVRKLSAKTTWISIKLNSNFISEIEPIDSRIKKYILKKKGLVKSDGIFKRGTCYLCHSENIEIVDKFKIPKMTFGTLDKKENISMNQKDDYEYKMCSVCKECQKLFNDKFSNMILEEYVTTFYGLKIIILPSLISENKEYLSQIKDKVKRYNYEYKIIKDEIKALTQLKKDLKKLQTHVLQDKKDLLKKEKIEREIGNNTLGSEYNNFSEFGMLSNYLDDNLIFSVVLYETASSQFILYDVIEDISKTRLSSIAEVHKQVADRTNNNFNIDFIYYYQRLLKYQFDNESKDIYKYVRKQFMVFIKSLLLSSKINKEHLIRLFMDYINKEFYNQKEDKRNLFLYFETKKIRLLLEFLSKINCLEG